MCLIARAECQNWLSAHYPPTRVDVRAPRLNQATCAFCVTKSARPVAAVTVTWVCTGSDQILSQAYLVQCPKKYVGVI